MAAHALLARHADPTDGEVIAAMQGNICRCGTYPRILQAIQQAAAALRAVSVAEGVR